MPYERRVPKAMNGSKQAPIRASISFPPRLYRTIEHLARQKKVSMAWIVRDAAEEYVVNRKHTGEKKRA
jgi:metal-responsive CopG/Arc/MetJ family transcriptional regulator